MIVWFVDFHFHLNKVDSDIDARCYPGEMIVTRQTEKTKDQWRQCDGLGKVQLGNTRFYHTCILLFSTYLHIVKNEVHAFMINALYDSGNQVIRHFVTMYGNGLKDMKGISQSSNSPDLIPIEHLSTGSGSSLLHLLPAINNLVPVPSGDLHHSPQILLFFRFVFFFFFI